MVDQTLITIRNYQRLAARARAQLVGVAKRSWIAQGSYRGGDVDDYLALLMPQLIAGRMTIAQLTDTYLATMTGTTPQGVDPVMAETLRRAITDREVYTRPFRQVWISLAQGRDLNAAVDAGMVRLVSLIETDLQLAKQAQEQATLTAAEVRFYRRVLTGAENCTMCVIASTQRYTVGTLAPMHPGCDCSVAPILGTSDPGQVINQDLLEQMHYEVGEKLQTPDGQQIDYRDVTIREHPEFGPTLTLRTRSQLNLEPHEVEFERRFTAAGHQMTWIPKKKTAPTNDFVWHDQGDLEIELKSVSRPEFKKIRSRIEKAMASAANHQWNPITKDQFVIDLGDLELTNTLRAELGDYNVGRHSHRLTRLWVWSQGRVEEIHLRK